MDTECDLHNPLIGVVHLIIGCIREFSRYGMIKKHHYDYCDTYPQRSLWKIGHNINHVIFRTTAFHVSISLMVLAFIVFHKPPIGSISSI
jgi:hypothetical protein